MEVIFKMIITFGKYENKDIEDLPSSYLEWCLENFKEENEIYLVMDKEYQFREKTNSHFEED